MDLYDPMCSISFLLTVNGISIGCSVIDNAEIDVMTTDIAAATSRTGRI